VPEYPSYIHHTATDQLGAMVKERCVEKRQYIGGTLMLNSGLQVPHTKILVEAECLYWLWLGQSLSSSY